MILRLPWCTATLALQRYVLLSYAPDMRAYTHWQGTTYSPIILPVTGREKEDDIKVRNLASAWEQAPPEDGTSIMLDSIIDEIVNVPEKFPSELRSSEDATYDLTVI